ASRRERSASGPACGRSCEGIQRVWSAAERRVASDAERLHGLAAGIWKRTIVWRFSGPGSQLERRRLPGDGSGWRAESRSYGTGSGGGCFNGREGAIGAHADRKHVSRENAAWTGTGALVTSARNRVAAQRASGSAANAAGGRRRSRRTGGGRQVQRADGNASSRMEDFAAIRSPRNETCEQIEPG